VEYGALSALQAAKKAGKVSVVAYLSPHHATREKWVDAEYERFPELLTPERKTLLLKGSERNARRDEENKIADVFHCASRFTKDSLVAAGIPAEKIFCVPLGCPDPMVAALPSYAAQSGTHFLYSGPVSVRKGAHVLLAAWKLAGMTRHSELHFYGRCTVPERILTGCGDQVVFHGNVSKPEIGRAYQESSILVFPTLCDGFGMVVAEAFANGLPVITTPNAGASDLIVDGRNGFIVPPGDPEALAQRMQWCVRHPREVFAMREEALNTARRWNWAAFRASFASQLSSQIAAWANLKESSTQIAVNTKAG
jgi:glycosyltransferase involved in cell wall biosynthesis